MSSKNLEEELKVIGEAQENASKLLKDEKAFNESFEKIFKLFDANKDGSIGAGEYAEFFQLMVANGKKMNLSRMMINFERADKDKDGSIDKEEFKKELKKRLKEFVENQPKK